MKEDLSPFERYRKRGARYDKISRALGYATVAIGLGFVAGHLSGEYPGGVAAEVAPVVAATVSYAAAGELLTRSCIEYRKAQGCLPYPTSLPYGPRNY